MNCAQGGILTILLPYSERIKFLRGCPIDESGFPAGAFLSAWARGPSLAIEINSLFAHGIVGVIFTQPGKN
jgi:hypothetical protein